jgi:DNA-nicking Smr family endonuclease
MKKSQEMPKKTDQQSDDKTALDEAMRGVKKLVYTKIPTPPVKVSPKRAQIQLVQPEEEYFIFSDYEKLDPVGSNDLIQFARPGLQHKVLRNLRQGHYNMEAILDLHGMTSEEAKESISRFLTRCKSERIRYVLMIHGKGRSHYKPILKNKLNHWLRQTDDVLAFCSAVAKDGSTGALYVLLRR